ncbi:putative ABC transporter permease [Treponema sp.]|uniref:putative ABC transporter permease n=1 Tax=Treponema sp. TaxID=166 RepID=UPI00298DFA22|nr:putative ABC transporter permease [Treponema sp.]MCQ2241494.1 putative ABC transporter permease [Treponema sp.]
MNLFLAVTFLFFAGSLGGWLIELIWRRFFSSNNPERKWINPGYLTGPYLPLYGFSLTILFFLSLIDVSFIERLWLQKIFLFVLMALSITVFEYIAGIIFIKGMKIKLWDYSKCWGNFQGIICPMYTFFWYILSATYYFFIHPRILNWLYWFTAHLGFSFVVGLFFGLLISDFAYTMNVMTKLRTAAKENEIILRIEYIQHHLRLIREERKERIHFWFSFKGELSSLREAVIRFKENLE